MIVGYHILNMLPNLEILVLSQTSITNIGVKTLSYYPDRFKILQLYATHITDESIPYLKLMTKLQFLDIRNTKITPYAYIDLINFFQHINPDIQII